METACRLCSAYDALVLLREGDQLRVVAHYGPIPVTFASQAISRGLLAGRAIIERQAIAIDDIAKHTDEYPVAAALASRGAAAAGLEGMIWRANLVAPLMREGEAVGVIGLRRSEPVPFSEGQIELLKTFSDQAVIAIENARLFDEVQARTRDLDESLQQQTATADVLKVISRSAFDLQAVLDTLASSAAGLIGADFAVTYLRRDDAIRAAATFGCAPELVQYLADHPQKPGRKTLAGRVFMSGEVQHIPDVLADPEYDFGAAPKVGNFRALLGAPMFRDGKVEGSFTLGRKEPGPFSQRQINIVQTFADQAVIAVENVRLFDEAQAKTRDLEESLQQQTATADVLKVISRSAFDLPAVLRTLVESAAKLCDADKATITRESDGVFYRAESYGFSEDFMAQVRNRPVVPEKGSITGRVFLEGKAVHVEDVQADPEYWPKTFMQPGELRTGLGIPMMRNGAPIGVLALMRSDVRAFNDRQIELVQTFADQAVIAIENARLFDEVQAKTRDLSEALVHQTASGNILKVIASSPTKVAPALQAIVESACEVCDAYDAAVILREGDHVRFSAHCGPIPIGLETWPLSRGWVGGRSIVDKVPVHVADLQLAGEEFPDGRDFALRMGHRTILAAPLLREGESVGAIVVRRKEAHPFSDKQIKLLRSFADQAVIAIGNVRLFDEVQAKTRDLEESLTQQTATADVLKVISRSAFDLQTVFESLISTAVRLCSAKQGVIFRRQGEIYRYAASHMLVDPAYRAHEQMAQIKAGRGTLIGRVALENRAVQISDAWTDSEYAEKDEVRHADVRAMLGVPLMRDGEMIGAFALGRAEPVPFSQRQVDLVATFADQAVIAIENARLFDEVQAKTRDVEEALQQQTATADVLKVISRSAFDLQAVLTTLAESARELCGASFATLFMLDRDGDEMRLRAESGCTPEIVAFLRAHPIKAGRETFTGRVMLSGEAVHLPDVLADPEYDFGDAPRIGDYRALLGVPLLRDGQVEGVFALARPEPTPFTERQIEMVRAFADQAVIAIENSRLFEEVQARTRELAASLDDLRKAQDRLIQSEKLASLGQLTAGIAHEIKNPLNFINNYAALSRELIDELAEATKNDAANGATQGEADELIGAIGGNLDKIVQHGKRADSIVKNMLLHSREGSGERSATNVNAMVEEALNLAYHGARAEKPGFNVTIVKSLDPNAGLAEVYAQEMTRVLLNLISNGFYATSKRKQSLGNGAYEPTISASTRDLGVKVEIAIRDNGTGIPDQVKAKMFNPFFTTKPAGEGTGLGLSLSHDIVVKQHGGAIEVSTEPDAFTEFSIVLPRGAVRS